MPFWTYCQNNSGGYLDGPRYVIVEADNCTEANHLAQSEGDVYFDGCDNGFDCECCGDRWSRANERDGTDEPMIYGVRAEEYAENLLIIKKNKISS